MHVTKWGEYGILCSLFLASKSSTEESVSALEIAEAQAIPLQYAHQILLRLRRGGIITSERGPKGGFRLSRAPEEINLRELLEASEGQTFEVICESKAPYGELCGKEHHCALSTLWHDLKLAIDQVLESRTLGSLLENHEFFPKDAISALVSIQSRSKKRPAE
ncbi:MAG: RrF2 family transcriptional regulator [Bdellovibrionota bacterium]|jgi:Rrf2 family protein